MVNQKLVDYIKDCKNKGFEINIVRDHLIKNKYPLNEVDEAISYVDFENEQHNPSKKVKEETPFEKERPTSITVIGILWIVFGGIGVLMSIWIWFFTSTLLSLLPGINLIEPYVIIIAISLILSNALSIIAGYGLLKLKKWGRTLGIVLSIITLLGIPIGTIIGIVYLYILKRKNVKEAFMA